jgi:hypothetical protein
MGAKQSLLQRLAATQPTDADSRGQLTKRLFSHCDRDQSGVLERREGAKFASAVVKFATKVDVDLQRRLATVKGGEVAQLVFTFYDTNADGMLNKADVTRCLEDLVLDGGVRWRLLLSSTLADDNLLRDAARQYWALLDRMRAFTDAALASKAFASLDALFAAIQSAYLAQVSSAAAASSSSSTTHPIWLKFAIVVHALHPVSWAKFFAARFQRIPTLQDVFPGLTLDAATDANDSVLPKQASSTTAQLGFDFCSSAAGQLEFRTRLMTEKRVDADLSSELLTVCLLDLRRFFHLRSLGGVGMVVPTLFVDLVWHAFLVHSPPAYAQDSRRLLEFVMDHDDGVAEEKLNTQFAATAALYESTYGESYDALTGDDLIKIRKHYGGRDDADFSTAFVDCGGACGGVMFHSAGCGAGACGASCGGGCGGGGCGGCGG